MLGAFGTVASADIINNSLHFVVNSTGGSGADLTVSARLVDPPYSSSVGGGNTSANGSLYKDGSGIMLLTAANTYTGPTVVQNGTLVTSATNSTSGGALVMTNATLNLNAIPSSLNVASITATNSIWSFNLGTNGNPAFPVINAAGNYTAEGIISVKIQSSGNTLTAGNLVLIHYTGSDLSNATYATPKLPTGFSVTQDL